MSTPTTKILIFAAAFLCAGLFAADTPNQETPPPPTVASLTAERDALQSKVAELQLTVDQLSAAARKLQEQRNAALDAEVQRAMQAIQPTPKK